MRWCTEPPIYIVDADELEDIVERFIDSLEGWAVEGGDAESDAWNKRVTKTAKVARDFGSDKQDWHYAYVISGEVVGIMTAAEGKDRTYRIEALFTHPGQRDAGALMVDFAVADALAKGLSGDIFLISYDADSTKFYAGCGFVSTGFVEPEGGGPMLLRVKDKPDIWKPVDGGYRLARFEVGTTPERFVEAI